MYEKSFEKSCAIDIESLPGNQHNYAKIADTPYEFKIQNVAETSIQILMNRLKIIVAVEG